MAREKTVMDEFQDILRDRRGTSDFLWASRNWVPVRVYAQPKTPTPNGIKSEVLSSHQLDIIVHNLSKVYNVSEKSLFTMAGGMLNEIGYERVISVLRWLAFITAKILKKLHLGVMVNEHKFLSIRSQLGRNPVLLVPNHRSYGDFILMSYCCFHFDIDIPRIAAGMDFHSMTFMGGILRKACAFFMRRSFTTDKLYAAVFGQYVQSLIVNGDASVEFFIEGTRSRTAKSLMPKYGFLSMALKPYITALVPDITILPVSFTYDRVLEERLFAFELLGVPKPKESTKGLFKALSILKENRGYVYINFGDPISAKEYFGSNIDRSVHNFGPVELQQITPEESKQIVRLAHNISCVPLSVDELVSEVEWLSSVMTGLGANLTVSGHLYTSVLRNINLHKSLVTITPDKKIKLLWSHCDTYETDKSKMRGHCLSCKTMDIAIPLLMIQYYSNPCAHFLVNLCFVSLIVQFQKNGTLSADELCRQFRFLRSIFANEFVLDKETEEEDFVAAFEFSKSQSMVIESGSEVKPGGNDKLHQFCASFMRLYICSYLIVIDVLLKEPGGPVSDKVIMKNYQEAVESLVIEDIRIHPAALSLDLVTNALQAVVHMKGAKKIRSENQICYEMIYDELAMIRSQLGIYQVVTKLNGTISEHLSNFVGGKL